MCFSQAFEGEPSQSRVPAPQFTHAPEAQVCVFAAHGTAVPHWPLASQV
jgi:hypothetical protein